MSISSNGGLGKPNSSNTSFTQYPLSANSQSNPPTGTRSASVPTQIANYNNSNGSNSSLNSSVNGSQSSLAQRNHSQSSVPPSHRGIANQSPQPFGPGRNNLSPLQTIEPSVTRLLVATKRLLESITQWSQGEASEQQVSDVYVTLGNEFNVACRAFLSSGVDVA